MQASVRTQRFKRSALGGISAAIGCALILMAGSAAVMGAESKPAGPQGADQPERIRISADNLTVDNQRRFAEFKGNVKAQQGTSEIRSDSLKIFYKQDLNSKDKSAAGEESIEKIIAAGNVKIRFDDKLAVSEEAVYTMAAQTLMLTGPSARVISGNDSISGAKITLHRTTGKIDIEGDTASRVEAIFYPGEKGAVP